MLALQTGLWHWEDPHWKPGQAWDQVVSSVLPTHGAPTDRAALERALGSVV